MSWIVLKSVFPDFDRFSDFAPAVANHGDALYIVWQDKVKNALWWCRSRPNTTFPSPTAINKGAEVQAMAAPGLITVGQKLHLIFAQQDCGGALFHLQFDDLQGLWLHRAGVGLTSQYAPTLAAINGQILCVARNASDANEDTLRWTLWDPVDGWSRAQVVSAITPNGPVVQSADGKPALVQIGLNFHLIVPLGSGFVQLRFDIDAYSWTPVPATIKEQPTTGCDGIGYPSLNYGFVAYGVESPSSVSVSQYNLNTWQVREGLDQETKATPILVILGSYVHCFWVDNDRGLLCRAVRPIDIGTDDWMKKLPDKTPIYSVTIPGTHDSAATAEFMTPAQAIYPFVVTQNMNIPQQLNLGIRFLDLRLSLDGTGTLVMVHRTFGLGSTFAYVIDSLVTFLAENPSETVLVSIKNDSDGDAILFETAVAAVIAANPNLWYDGDILPIMKDCRGRLILFRRYPITMPTIGFDVSGTTLWPDDTSNSIIPIATQNTTVVVQDHYNFTFSPSYNKLLNAKWTTVLDLLDQTQTVSPDKRTLFFNFFSAAGLPLNTALDVATGGFYLPEDAEKYAFIRGMNQRMWNYLNDSKDKKLRRLGVLIFDYPEVPAGDLINAIIDLNFK